MAFYKIAVPHRDILSGSISREEYAANLWDVHTKRGSDRYVDAKTFFKQTYMTDNLNEILGSVKSRLDGNGGGHFRSMTTQFGGGKTHALIALYHKCAEWGAKPVVLAGNKLDPMTQTLWGTIEEQITGSVSRLEGQVPRGSEALRDVIAKHGGPVLILIDELLHYVGKAEAVKINDTTLAVQTIAFMQELGEAARGLDNVCVVATLASSDNEQLNSERAAQLLDRLKKVVGRTKDTVTPVSDADIPLIIRRKLFSTSDEEIRAKSEQIVGDFVRYCDEENIIPEGRQPSQYREDFANSYPFLPQVIDVIYHRWGSLPQFQRTRGVLHLLSRVVESLLTSDRDYISLGDFDLGNDSIRSELVDYLDQQFHSVIAKDITGSGSGAAKVNAMVPDQYRVRKLGTRAASAIFMHSHSGAAVPKGATEAEIKRAACEVGIPAAQIGEVINLLRTHLFYLNVTDYKYLFTTEENILKRKVEVMDNLRQSDIGDAEKTLVKKCVSNIGDLRVVLWPDSPRDVGDTPPLKLVIMRDDDPERIQGIYDTVGESPRIYRNNLFFLTPSASEKERFLTSLKSKVAWEKIMDDTVIPMKDDQRKLLKAELSKEADMLDSLVKDYYSNLYIPKADGLKPGRINPPLGVDTELDRIVYDHLVENEAVHPAIGANVLKADYLQEHETVDTHNMLNSMLSAPGSRRPINRGVLEKAIKDGVTGGHFGLGEMREGKPEVKFFKTTPEVSFDAGEVLISNTMCKKLLGQEEPPDGSGAGSGGDLGTKPESFNDTKTNDSPGTKEEILYPRLEFTFSVPEGEINKISQMLLKIASHYPTLALRVFASEGGMTKHDMDMIKETLDQIGSKHDLE